MRLNYTSDFTNDPVNKTREPYVYLSGYKMPSDINQFNGGEHRSTLLNLFDMGRWVLVLICGVVFLTATSMSSSDISVTSPAFQNNGSIPMRYSCEGIEASPALQLSNVPKETKSLAIIMHDPDAPMAGGFTHWVMWNITPGKQIGENFTDGRIGLNSKGVTSYAGMCPPTGTHHYHFRVYALNAMLDIPSADKAGLEKAMQGHILAEGELTGLYAKKK